MNDGDRRRAVVGGVLALGAFVIYTGTLAPGLTWLHDGADGGDLARAAALGSLPHPTGYPTYLLLARVFLLVPMHDAAFRLNLLSAASTAAAVGLFAALQAHPEGGNRAAGYAGGVIGALALAVAPLIWSQAVITEVYGLHLLCAVAFLAAWSAWRRSCRARMAGLAGLAGGIGLGNHVTLVFLAPMLIASAFDQRASRRQWVGFLAGLALGLGVYLYLPLAQLSGAPSPWGQFDTPGAWLSYVSGAPYRSYVFTVLPPDVAWRLLAMPGLAWNEFAPWGIALALLGARAAWRRSAALASAHAACALLSIAFSAGYNTADAFRYLMVAWLMMAIWIAEGGRALAASLQRRVQWGAITVIAVGLVLGAVSLSARWNNVDASSDLTAVTSIERALGALPQNAILVTRTDRQTFALWYYIDALHRRPDVEVVDQDMFEFVPYRAYLASRWRAAGRTPAALAAWLGGQGDRPVYLLDSGGDVRMATPRDFDATPR